MNDRESTSKPNVTAPHGRMNTDASSFERVAELEFENRRLQGLIAELLLKNQKLRAALAADSHSVSKDRGSSPDWLSL